MFTRIKAQQVQRKISNRTYKSCAEQQSSTAGKFNKYQSNLSLLGALQQQVQKETLPWVRDLIEPYTMGTPQPLEGLVSVDELADSDSKFAIVNGIRIHYKECGSTYPNAPTFVLLHGFNGSTFQWRCVMDDLSNINFGNEKCRVIAIDRPPFGLSERPKTWPKNQPNPFSIAGGVMQTIGLLDVLGINEFIVVGHSAGANIAAHIATEFPDRVSDLVFISPAISIDRNSSFRRDLGQWLRFLYLFNLINQDGPAVNYIRNIIQKRIKEVEQGKGMELYNAGGSVDVTSKQYQEGYLKPTKFEGWDRGLVENIRCFDHLEGVKFSKLKNSRALVINGEKDKTTTVKFVKAFFDKFVENGGIGTYQEIQNCGHLPMEEKPKYLVQLIKNYFEERYNVQQLTAGDEELTKLNKSSAAVLNL